jgi:hypothetical protein
VNARWALVAAAFVAWGCGEEFSPPSEVTGLRILAIQVEPPEIGAREGMGQEAVITSLVADPAQLDDPDRSVLVAYLSCTPDPLDQGPNPCTAIAALRDPSELQLPRGTCGDGGGDGGGGGTPGPEAPQGLFQFLGAERCDQAAGCGPMGVVWGGTRLELPPPTYRLEAAPDLGTLPAEHPKRMRGLQVVVFALAVVGTEEEVMDGLDPTDPCFGPTVAERFLGLVQTREHRMAIKRIQVRGPDLLDEPNVNPQVGGILARGVPLPAVGTLSPGSVAHLHPRPPAPPVDDRGVQLPFESLLQPYSRLRLDGTVVKEEREKWVYSWFGTAGHLDAHRSNRLDETVSWELPRGEHTPESGRAFVYLVVRDGRGGVSWVVREVLLASP